MYEELLEKRRLSSLENRRLQDILILMYKVKNSLAPEHVCNMFFSKISIITYEVIFLFQDIRDGSLFMRMTRSGKK